MNAHFLNLLGASLLRTVSWVLGREAILETVDARAIASITGPPGTGKSFLLSSVAPEISMPVKRIEFDHRPTMRSITTQLLQLLTGEEPRGSKHILINPLIHALERPRVLLVDEAQRLNRECLDHLRFLHDHPNTDFALVLAGGQGCWEVLGREPQLRRRIYRPVFFRPLTIDEVHVGIPKLHPLWKQATPKQLDHIDGQFAAGMLGNWAAITKTFSALLDRGHDFDDRLVAAALLKHGVLDDNLADIA